MYIYGNVALYLMQNTRYLDLVIEKYGVIREKIMEVYFV